MYCPNCGNYNEEDAVFCGSCGIPLQNIAEGRTGTGNEQPGSNFVLRQALHVIHIGQLRKQADLFRFACQKNASSICGI